MTRDSAFKPCVSLLTPPSPSGIAVLSVSGAGALGIVNRIFQPARKKKHALPSRARAKYGHIQHGGQVLDEVLLVCLDLEKPSFEICCHGGTAPASAILDLLVELGAELRPWSHHEWRKTLEHDLLLDLLKSEGRRQAALLAHLYSGSLREAFDSIQQALDSLQSGDEVQTAAGARAKALTLMKSLEASYELGRYLHRPPFVVITGRANVGKSTLFNALLGEHRVLTSRLPGTTRDPVEATLLLQGFPLRLVDLPGDGGGPDSQLDQRAQKEAKRWKDRADLILRLSAPGKADIEKGGIVSGERKKVPRTLRIYNKADLDSNIMEILKRPPSSSGAEHDDFKENYPLYLSALREEGLERLEDRIGKTLNIYHLSSCFHPLLVNRRQLSLVRKARSLVENRLPEPEFHARFRSYLSLTRPWE